MTMAYRICTRCTKENYGHICKLIKSKIMDCDSCNKKNVWTYNLHNIRNDYCGLICPSRKKFYSWTEIRLTERSWPPPDFLFIHPSINNVKSYWRLKCKWAGCEGIRVFALQLVYWQLARDGIVVPMDILKEIYGIIRMVSIKQADMYMWRVYLFHTIKHS